MNSDVIGPVLIWYAAGAAILAIVILDIRAKRSAVAARPKRPYSHLLWLALAIGGLIFGLWPWVALSLARNATM